MAIGKHIVEHAILGVDDTVTLDTRYVNVTGDTMIGPNSTTFFQIQQADTTPVFNVDTTNLATIIPDGAKLKLGTGQDGEIFSSGDDLYIKNITLNKNISFNVNDGGVDKQALFIQGTTGNVGIGTTAPETKLKIYNSSQPVWTKWNDGTNYLYAGIPSTGETGSLRTNGALSLYTGGVGSANERIRITSDGNVGIGTTGPGAKLEVVGSSFPVMRLVRTSNLTTGSLSSFDIVHKTTADAADGLAAAMLFSIQDNGLSSPSTIAGIIALRDGADNSGKLNFAPYNSGSGVPAMTIKSSGNVGIGVTDPDTKLEVFGSTGLKISFDATDNTTLVTDTNGDLTITPSGTSIIIPSKLAFTQTDLNEYIDSLADGYMDYRATTAHRFGDGTNQAIIKADGEINLEGTARVYKVVPIRPSGFSVPGTKPATSVEHGIGMSWEFTDGTDDTIEAEIQLPQDMDKTVAPEFNIGWDSDTADPGDDTKQCVWQLEYLYLSLNEDVTAAAQETLPATTSASTTENGLVVTTITGLDLPSASDRFMMIRIKRLGADGSDTLGDVAYLNGCGLKYTSDKLGVAT